MEARNWLLENIAVKEVAYVEKTEILNAVRPYFGPTLTGHWENEIIWYVRNQR
jgi:hypothetical protein